MHVEGKRRRAAETAEFRRRETISAIARAAPAVLLGNADAEQALAVHVAEVLERKARLAVVLRGAWRQHPRAEPPRLRDQLRLGVAKQERLRREHRGASVMSIEIAVHEG